MNDTSFSFFNQINKNIQKEKSKSIEEIEITIYHLIKDDEVKMLWLKNGKKKNYKVKLISINLI